MSEIDTRSLTDRVYDYLLNQIITGAIKYGETLSIRSIAEELKISTMPVREAVKRLAFEQIVEIKPRSSCQVKVPTRSTIADVYDAREMLELHALSKSLNRPDPEKLAALWRIVEEMRAVEHEKDSASREKRAVDLDRRFHAGVCRLADNQFIDQFYRQLALHVNMTLIHQKTYDKLKKQYCESHAEILRCLEKDPPAALEVLRKHFLDTKRVLLNNDKE
jgi:DNA-binding GntR family transcriptional regulator